MRSSEIRAAFLRFFEERGHKVVPSSPVVPEGDPTLLFTNAGMNQFKDTFLGLEKRAYARAASSQKCVRAGGKHNDLEQVGKTARHLTFFEMLGNFSFGDYFKEDAIRYAWAFLTEVLDLPKDRLWVTVFETDDEAARLWEEVAGVAPERIVRLGEKDNFWQMGDVGPCGPCTEIHYDYRDDPAARTSFTEDHCTEFWNLVFMQYERAEDGALTELPSPCVDTGMGLERLSCILQKKATNFETDLLRPLIDRVAERSGVPYEAGEAGTPHRVIADHVRTLSFAFADGALPSNEGRGYVLRRILRRAARYGRKLGIEEAFLFELVPTVIEIMGDAYPELAEREQHITHLVKDEEESFNRTLDRGLSLFFEAADEVASRGGSQFPGYVAFKLYDTYGFPADLTRILCEERGLTWDEAGFQDGMEAQKERSRGAQQFKARDLSAHGEVPATEFLGYRMTSADAEVLSFDAERGELVLDRTPFYAESGGQVGDRGVIAAGDGSFRFVVEDTQKAGGVYLHRGRVDVGGPPAPGTAVRADVDAGRRARTEKNHTATHLLHWALHEVVGQGAQQAGSVVEPERLRFDFTHPRALSDDEVETIERMVNAKIMSNDRVQTYIRSLDEAKASGVTALFGEKYGERVRVVDVEGYSRELCGGNHVSRTGDIGLFKIVQEQAVQSGVRRVVALTGPAAIEWAIGTHRRVKSLSRALSAPEDQVEERVERLKDQVKEWKKKAKEAAEKAPAAAAAADAAVDEDLSGVRFRIVKTDAGMGDLRRFGDEVKKDKKPHVALFASLQGPKMTLLAAVSGAARERGLDATQVLKAVNAVCGGGSGGRPDMAQAGGLDAARLDDAAKAAREAVATAVIPA